MKDSNIPVVLVAAKCLTALSKGLRQGFRNYAVAVSAFQVAVVIRNDDDLGHRCLSGSMPREEEQCDRSPT